MDKVKQHWPKIAVGTVALAAIGYYAYKSN